MGRLFSSFTDWHNTEQENIALCYKQWIGQNKNKLQQLCCSGFGCSGMWRRVTWLVFPDVSKKGIAFIFMGLGLQEKWRMTHQTVKMKALRFFLNVGKHQFSATAFSFVLWVVVWKRLSIAVKLLCCMIRYCGCAGQAVIGICCCCWRHYSAFDGKRLFSGP
jgi:hypothetical protein